MESACGCRKFDKVDTNPGKKEATKPSKKATPWTKPEKDKPKEVTASGQKGAASKPEKDKPTAATTLKYDTGR